MEVGSQIHRQGLFSPGKESLLPTEYEVLTQRLSTRFEEQKRLLHLTGIEKRIQPLA